MTTDRQSLPAATTRLHNAINTLINPTPITIQRDNNTTETTWLDPPIQQLLDAITGQTGQRSGGTSTIPIWADILDEITRITTKLLQWQPETPTQTNPGEHLIFSRLRALNERTWSVENTKHVNTIADQLEKTAATIRDKLTPEPVIYLMAPHPHKGPAACTNCGTKHVYRPDPSDNNKPKRQPALKVTKDGCKCQNPQCGATWEPGQLKVLAAALGYPQHNQPE